MRRISTALLAAALLVTPGGAADGPAPPAGNWKFVLPLNPAARPMWILRLAQKDGSWSGAVIARSEENKQKVPPATLGGLSVADDTLRFTLRTTTQVFRFEGKVPKEAGFPVLGSATVSGDVVPARLEPTALTALDTVSVSREVLARQKDGPEVVQAAMTLLGKAPDLKAKPEEVRAWAERAVKAAEPYGASWRRDILLSVAEILAGQEELAAEALPFARQAEKLLDDKDPVSLKKRTLDVLATALERAGKTKDVLPVQARADAIDISVKPKPYAGKRGGRVALVELFTGSQCPPCVAADLAFDALGKAFKPTEVVRLEYHLHIPGPDALTSPGSLARKEYYEKEIDGTPTAFISGRRLTELGGSRADGPDKYADLAELAAGLVEQAPKAAIKLTATRKGSQVEIKADVSDLAETGEAVRLRLALVEDEVAYVGTNGIPSSQNVVRALPGGADGTPLKEKTGSRTVTVDLDKLRKELAEYLDKFAAQQPFPSKARPLDLKKLSVVAFVQNDETGEVLQAAQAEVAE
jgi:hypothetical protein